MEPTDRIGTAPARDLVVTRVFDAPVEQVWRALTEPEQVKRWWGPAGFTVPVVEMDLREGGSALVSMQAPAEMGGRHPVQHLGVYPDRPERAAGVYPSVHGPGPPGARPPGLGIPASVPDEVLHVIALKDLGGRTRMIYAECGYTTKEARETSRAGLEQVLDKLAGVLKRR